MLRRNTSKKKVGTGSEKSNTGRKKSRPPWPHADEQAGVALRRAEDRKRDHYTELSKSHHFVPIAAETFGAWAPASLKFLKDLGQKIRQISGQQNSLFFLLQSLSIEIQRGNAASVMGTLDSAERLEEVFYL